MESINRINDKVPIESESDDSDFVPNHPNDESESSDDYSDDDDVDMDQSIEYVDKPSDLIDSKEDAENNKDKDDSPGFLDSLNENEYEQYRIWKKNCQYLYDYMVTNFLYWPSLTVEWLPTVENISSTNDSVKEYIQQRLVLGTDANEEMISKHPNLLIIATQTMPVINSSQIAAVEGSVCHNKKAKLDHTVSIFHDGSVNRARSNPYNEFIIATFSSKGNVYIFDYSKHESDPKNAFEPDLILKQHKDEGFGLCWNRRNKNILATGCFDSSICIWDIEMNSENKTKTPVCCFNGHEGEVNDVKWHHFEENLLGSVGQDCKLKIWDLRTNSNQKEQFCVEAHNDVINALCFNSFSEYALLTASDDRSIKLFDLRNLSRHLHRFSFHTDDVYDVEWSPHQEPIFASAGKDKKLIIWDLRKINSERPINEKDFPAEMVFYHGGHTKEISNLAWNYYDQDFMASVSANNELHLFKPNVDLSNPK